MNAIIDDIELAIAFISTNISGDSKAFLSLATGTVLYCSKYLDEEPPLPDDIDDRSKYLPIPHKRDLNLGVVLVFDFVEQRLPNKASEVWMMFRKRGAYSRFSDWLRRHKASKTCFGLQRPSV